MQKHNFMLYLLVLLLGWILALIAAGGGLFGQEQPWLLQWQHQLFAAICHQIPERSFWIKGQPMAVCSRCLGIYAGFALGWLLLPAMAAANGLRSLPVKKVLFVTAVINLADIVGNFSGFWENTHTSRLVLGCMLGLAAAVLFSGAFFNRKIKPTGKHYGRITTPGI